MNSEYLSLEYMQVVLDTSSISEKREKRRLSFLLFSLMVPHLHFNVGQSFILRKKKKLTFTLDLRLLCKLDYVCPIMRGIIFCTNTNRKNELRPTVKVTVYFFKNSIKYKV